MATYIKLSLDKRRIKSDNTYPIVYKITHNRVPTTLKTNYCVEEAYWDTSSLQIRKGAKSVKHISTVNLLLKSREAKMMKLIIELDEDNLLDSMLVNELVNKLKQTKISKNNTFVSYTEQVISDLKLENKVGNAYCYQDASNFLVTYSKKSDVSFSQITNKLLHTLENNYMSKTDNHYNGLSVYMRTIRAIYNRAIADGVANINQYPFRQRAGDVNKYQIKNEKTKLTLTDNLSEEEISKLSVEEQAVRYNKIGKAKYIGESDTTVNKLANILELNAVAMERFSGMMEGMDNTAEINHLKNEIEIEKTHNDTLKQQNITLAQDIKHLKKRMAAVKKTT